MSAVDREKNANSPKTTLRLKPKTLSEVFDIDTNTTTPRVQEGARVVSAFVGFWRGARAMLINGIEAIIVKNMKENFQKILLEFCENKRSFLKLF